VGLREYCAVRVAARMGLHAYAAPALAGAALYCTLSARAHRWEQSVHLSLPRISTIHTIRKRFYYPTTPTLVEQPEKKCQYTFLFSLLQLFVQSENAFVVRRYRQNSPQKIVVSMETWW
jgi:hypothetical protein